jgi:hypothetical protein
MQPNPERENTDVPKPGDPIAEMFGLPTGQWPAPQDAAPARSSRLHAVLSWLWQFVFEGFAVCGLAMHPCFEDNCDLSDFLAPRRREPAGPASVAPAESPPWQFETLVCQRPPIEGQPRHATFMSGYAGSGSPRVADGSQARP